jgi:aromatic-L-amino-acid/L-tryptophan decarboxylase
MTAVQENLGDIAPEEFRKHLHALADWIADYREKIDHRRVAPNEKPGAILKKISPEPPESGEALENILADVDRVIAPGMLHWGHPQFVSYFGCTTTAPGILADMICSTFNVNAMTWRTSPAATELETLVLDWLRQWLGLPNEFGGVVYDTASVGVMHALAIAREEAVGDAGNPACVDSLDKPGQPRTGLSASRSVRKAGLTSAGLPVFRIYVSDQAHSSADKAAIALGLGEENVVHIRSDADFRMDVSALADAIAADQRRNFKPLAVVATVGTTSTASVDPVKEIARLCREKKIFLHIDGAYGGGLALLPECGWVQESWNEADSLVINPHKMLFVPLDFSVLYVRDLERLRRVFSLVPDYLRGDSVGADINYMDYSIQLGRRFRAIKAWMVWRTFGRAGMAARIREHLRLANLLGDWIQGDSRFELSAPVVMPVVCFRLREADDHANSAVVEKINASGQAYLGQTKLHGKTCIRLGLGNILTTEEHLRNVWRLIQNAV